MDDLNEINKILLSNNYIPVKSLTLRAGSQRLFFDGEKKSSGSIVIEENEDGSISGTYGSSKDSAGFKSIHSRSGSKTFKGLSEAEKSALKAQRESKERKQADIFIRVGNRLKTAFKSYPDAISHPYLTNKCILPHKIKIRPKTGELLIPRYGCDGNFYSLQRIIQKNSESQNVKLYFKGARGSNLFYPIMEKTDDKSVLILAEGFATAASVYESTGIPAICCFDAGSLDGVLCHFSKKYPDSRFIIAADNDQWSFKSGKKPKEINKSIVAGDDPRWGEWREDGRLYNTGVDKARQAAVKYKAQVIFPDFPSNHVNKSTDFNDLMIEKGKEYVKNIFDKILEIPLVMPMEEAYEGGIHVDNPIGVQAPLVGDMGMEFKVLGYNNGNYYYYPFSSKQIVVLPASGHTMQNLLRIAPLYEWEFKYRDDAGKLLEKHATIALQSSNAMIQLAHSRGVFTEESLVRGVGCWLDDGRIVLHCGASLYVDGEFVDFNDINSDYTYVAGVKLLNPSDNQLSNKDARLLRTICESITWENQLSGTLLAGWLVIAPFCAALKYRPHIYLTGEAESGKSTVLNKIIKPVLGRIALCMDGGTTEPALREIMAYYARPLIYDEAEPSPSMGDVIMLARKASTGSVVKKFGQKAFKARFCGCFSAIHPPVNKTADESRISFMHLKKNRKPTALSDYENLLSLIDNVITPDFSEKMIARILFNMNSLLANIRIFQKAFRIVTGGTRASEQIGTMLAGVYMLGRLDVISEEDAISFVKLHDWREHTILDQDGDPIRLVQHITSSLIRLRSGNESTVGELIALAMESDLTGKTNSAVEADKILRNYGIAVKEGRVYIASRSQNLAKLLNNTEWKEKWSRTLSDVDNAEKIKSQYFSAGIKTSAVSLPIDLFVGYESTETEEILDF